MVGTGYVESGGVTKDKGCGACFTFAFCYGSAKFNSLEVNNMKFSLR
jgi:hypothetical protein